MSIYDDLTLSNPDKIKHGIALPVVMNILEICELWTDDENEAYILKDAIYQAFKRGKLTGKEKKQRANDMVIIGPDMIYDPIEINKQDFKTWLISEN